MNTEPDTRPQPSNGVVCPKCLLNNPSTAAFCADCGMPVGLTTITNPVGRSQAIGYVLRGAADGPPKRIVLLGIWLLFAPPVLAAPLVLLANNANIGTRLFVVAVFTIIPVTILYRTTKNYMVKSRLARAPNA